MGSYHIRLVGLYSKTRTSRVSVRHISRNFSPSLHHWPPWFGIWVGKCRTFQRDIRLKSRLPYVHAYFRSFRTQSRVLVEYTVFDYGPVSIRTFQQPWPYYWYWDEIWYLAAWKKSYTDDCLCYNATARSCSWVSAFQSCLNYLLVNILSRSVRDRDETCFRWVSKITNVCLCKTLRFLMLAQKLMLSAPGWRNGSQTKGLAPDGVGDTIFCSHFLDNITQHDGNV